MGGCIVKNLRVFSTSAFWQHKIVLSPIFKLNFSSEKHLREWLPYFLTDCDGVTLEGLSVMQVYWTLKIIWH